MKCDKCGKEFELKKENKYISCDSKFGLIGCTYYDTFDCPYCGCQHKINERYTKVNNFEKEEEKDE